MKRNRLIPLIPLVLVMFATFACSTNANTPVLAALPAPAGGKYPTSQIVQTIGEVEQVNMVSPWIDVVYGQTGSSSSIGGTASEKVEIYDLKAVMVETKWGDIEGGTLKVTESYDPYGNVIEGRVTLQIPEASILQWLHGCLECTIDRSRLTLEYVSPQPGQTPEFTRVLYTELWGATAQNPIALGQTGIWGVVDIFPQYSKWGWWETHQRPVQQVIQALETVEAEIQTTANYTWRAVDEDSLREVIGRQTGLHFYKNGEAWGTVELTYANNWGRMPNTELIGKGALSRIEWFLGNGEYRAISVLSPALSPNPTSLYVFSRSQTTANRVEGTDWPLLYDQIRYGEIPDVDFAIYSSGFIGKITGTVITSEGSGTADVGEGGGVFYSVVGDPTFEQILDAKNNLDLLGWGGIRATGFHYATSPGSGNGIYYYLAALSLIKADREVLLTRYGTDVGVLDRAGFPVIP